MRTSAAVVVADTTPLITLAGVGEIRLFPLLFGAVHIPEQVWDEYEKFHLQQQLPDLSFSKSYKRLGSKVFSLSSPGLAQPLLKV